MALLDLLKMAIAILTIATGLLGLLRPRMITGFTGLDAPGARGVSELRGVFGGLFIGLGLAPLLYNAPETIKMLGVAYLAIAIARTFSVLYDRSTERSNLISLAVEYVFGILLLL